MRDSFVRSLLSSVSSRDNLIQRIRGNLRDALAPGKWKMSSANGAPLHLLRFGGPPRKLTGAGVLDPTFSPKRPPGSIPSVPSSLLFRIVAGLVRAGLATALFFLLFALR